ncbi:MAG TPA: rod-binding protein [Rhizomicrobium sp.]|jgi:Rod binding domain-containing protein|nr:rod-binding protein [Rhizomicrobium sp.]
MMDATSSAQSAMFAAQQPAMPVLPKAGANLDAAKAAAVSKEYESVFISQFLGSMFSGIKTDGITGGGEGEEMFRSMMIDQYAKGLTARGGFGLASHMQAELMKYQQATSQ